MNIHAQFGKPIGIVGGLVGHLMALENRERSLWVMDLLDIQPTDRVLEIGFGSGMDIRRAGRKASGGFVAGVDHSEVMVRQAKRRNRAGIQAGQVDLRLGEAHELPYPAEWFDRVFAIDSAPFWRNPLDAVLEIRRVLKKAGMVALAVQPRNPGATADTTRATGESLRRVLTEGGFADVRLEWRCLRPVPAVCAIGWYLP